MNKKNLPLILALSIPIIMIIVLAMAIYLPGWNKKPQHNFIYATGDNAYYYGQTKYQIVDGYLRQNPQPATTTDPYYKPVNVETRLFLYDVNSNTASELTYEQASQYRLDSSQTSNDGYKVERGNYNGDFLFGSNSNDYNSWFIKGHNRSKKLNMKITSNDYYGIQFLGWVE
ncbi:MAG: hypothetical protein HY918_00650 [Candidatus Doudnabacteria bacterium]|nr:hypothetical protein [Candidatus Doudnabacteria bacterium]